ncbi:MAG: sulfite exporter TauE/SafE family protein [Vicinamibacterales bacterium]
MLSPKELLLAALLVVTAIYTAAWIRPRWLDTTVGFVTNFFDTLGIGSFATTTSFYRLRKQMPDELIPGTLNVGHTLPTVAQALIYITLVEVEFNTLALLIVAAVAGSWLGAGFVSRLPRRQIQAGMGMALFGAAVLMALTAMHAMPSGGTALRLEGAQLGVGIGVNFILGALMTLGIGLYAPCMVLVSLLGMNPTAAFPIMMGSCAFLMPAASLRFMRYGRYDMAAAIGLALGGVPAVLFAAYLVKSLPLDYVRWLVVAIAGYAAVTLIRSGLRTERA